MHKKIAYGGMATALVTILLVFSAYFPSGKAAALFLASATLYAFRIVMGIKSSFAVYMSSAILGLLLAFGASPVISVSFAICFGSYPVLRYITENKPLVLMIFIRAVLYTVYFVLVALIFKYLIPITFPLPEILLYILCGVLFVGYDVLLKYTGEYIVQLFYRIKK